MDLHTLNPSPPLGLPVLRQVSFIIYSMKFSYHQGDLAVLSSLCFKSVPSMGIITVFILICSHSLPFSLYFLLKGRYHNSEAMDDLLVMM